MGRRRKSRKPPPKRKILEPLDGVFNCPFCNHEKSCDVKMYDVIFCSTVAIVYYVAVSTHSATILKYLVHIVS